MHENIDVAILLEEAGQVSCRQVFDVIHVCMHSLNWVVNVFFRLIS